MKSVLFFLGCCLLYGVTLMQGGTFDEFRQTAERVNQYEIKALKLVKQNQALKNSISELKYKIQTLEAKNSFLEITLSKKKKASRKIASVSPKLQLKNDMVKDHIYKWSNKQLAKIGDNEFRNKNYEKSAQFFQTLLLKNPTNELVSDQLLFQAGVSAYESGVHYDWAISSLQKLVTEYPTSPYFRGAKLWIGLANLKMGNHKKFYSTVEEFRMKYRNTKEWKILSGHYEEFRQKYK